MGASFSPALFSSGCSVLWGPESCICATWYDMLLLWEGPVLNEGKTINSSQHNLWYMVQLVWTRDHQDMPFAREDAQNPMLDWSRPSWAKTSLVHTTAFQGSGKKEEALEKVDWPLGSGPGSSWGQHSSPRSVWRSSLPGCSSRPCTSAAPCSGCLSPPSSSAPALGACGAGCPSPTSLWSCPLWCAATWWVPGPSGAPPAQCSAASWSRSSGAGSGQIPQRCLFGGQVSATAVPSAPRTHIQHRFPPTYYCSLGSSHATHKHVMQTLKTCGIKLSVSTLLCAFLHHSVSDRRGRRKNWSFCFLLHPPRSSLCCQTAGPFLPEPFWSTKGASQGMLPTLLNEAGERQKLRWIPP